VIEPTDEMRMVFRTVGDDYCDCDDCLNLRLAAVLAIVERDHCMGARGHKHVEPSVEDWDWAPTSEPRCGKPFGEHMLCAREPGHGFPVADPTLLGFC
jgi:hypothetical protein